MDDSFELLVLSGDVSQLSRGVALVPIGRAVPLALDGPVPLGPGLQVQDEVQLNILASPLGFNFTRPEIICTRTTLLSRLIIRRIGICKFACLPNSRDRIVVSTLRCGRSNPGSNPGHGSCKKAVSAGNIYFSTRLFQIITSENYMGFFYQPY